MKETTINGVAFSCKNETCPYPEGKHNCMIWDEKEGFLPCVELQITKDPCIELDFKTMAEGIVECLPEYSQSLQCVKWNYTEGIFDFYDDETEKSYTITQKQVEDALPTFLNKCLRGEYNFLEEITNISDIGNWDTWDVDGLIQETLFGKVLYG